MLISINHALICPSKTSEDFFFQQTKCQESEKQNEKEEKQKTESNGWREWRKIKWIFWHSFLEVLLISANLFWQVCFEGNGNAARHKVLPTWQNLYT